jgi:gliding motility-associated-like protein
MAFFRKLFIITVVLSGLNSYSQNALCPDMEPICTDVGLTFTAGSGGVNVVSAFPTNNYGCMWTGPNPSWYYLEVGIAGNIDMTLTAGMDIDFVLWGPFADYTTAVANCGNLGNAPGTDAVVDCGISSSATEFVNIPGAVVGQVYVLLIANYASVVQDLTLVQSGGTGGTNCNIVTPTPCVSDPGSFVVEKNGSLTTTPIYLCEGDNFEVISNNDYILPNDTLPHPLGDGGYTAQLMWLVYDAPPTAADPALDPAFLNMIIPTEDLLDVNNGTSPIISGAGLGCGTYYFVPVAGDDGVGGNNNVANLTNDNGGLHWDKNNNDCYVLGTAIQVTYACEIQPTAVINCNPPATINGMDINLTGGSGNYTIVNQGDGNLVSTSVPNGGTATITNFENGDSYDIDITDTQGCTATINGTFAAPLIQSLTIISALTCPLGGNGTVNVTVNGTSGNGAPYTIVMAADPPTAGTTDTYSNVAGTLVNIVVADQEGCISDSLVTITSAGHFIDVQIVSQSDEDCYGDGNGSAQISAVPTPSGTVTSITWNGPSGQHPGGDPGGAGNNSQSALEPGNWSVTVVDNTGCEVTIPIVIGAPQQLDLYLTNSNEPVCYGFNDGSITVSSTGGVATITHTWNPSNSGTTFNNLTAGTYWAYATDANGCKDSLQIDLGQPDSLYGHFTIKDILCYGDSTGGIIVDSVSNAAGNVNYFWNLSGIVPNPPATSNLASGLPIGTYVLTIQDEFCSNQYEFTLVQNPAIVFAEFGSEPASCRMFSYQSGNGVVFASASGGVPDYSYEWENLGTGATSNNTTWGGLNPGSYQMTVTDDVGCTLVQTIVLDSLNPIADFDVVSDQLDANLEGTSVVCANFINQSLNYTNLNDPNSDTTFFWELGYNLPWQITHDIEEVFDTCYDAEAQFEVCLVVLNKNGCTDTACQILIVHDFPILIAPNVFTPGSDAANNVFEFNTKAVAISEFSCLIVDRWGKEVIAFDAITDSWDGTNKNGKNCPDGVYFYTYTGTATNSTTFEGQGTVTLVRNE